MTSREIPILFQTDMVRAILTCAKCGKISVEYPCCHCDSTEFRKTQTRRVIKPQPPQGAWPIYDSLDCYQGDGWAFQYPKAIGGGCTFNSIFKLPNNGQCPYGTVGDLQWVRERAKLIAPDMGCGWGGSYKGRFIYEADGFESDWLPYPGRLSILGCGLCVPNGCYKEIARIWLKVTGIRVERVQDISEEDAQAEGIVYQLNKGIGGETCYDDAIGKHKGEYRWLAALPPFKLLWDSINAKPKKAKHNPYTGKKEICYVSYPWEQIRETREKNSLPWYVVGNPWVWAESFQRTNHNAASAGKVSK